MSGSLAVRHQPRSVEAGFSMALIANKLTKIYQVCASDHFYHGHILLNQSCSSFRNSSKGRSISITTTRPEKWFQVSFWQHSNKKNISSRTLVYCFSSQQRLRLSKFRHRKGHSCMIHCPRFEGLDLSRLLSGMVWFGSALGPFWQTQVDRSICRTSRSCRKPVLSAI